MSAAGDPGWSKVLTPRVLFGVLLLPFLGPRRMMAGDTTQSALLLLRQLFVQFLVGATLMVAVAMLVAPEVQASRSAQTTAAAVLLVFGVACFATGAWIAGRRPYDCSDDEHLLASYRTRFFLRIAFADTVVLSGFIAVMVLGARWLIVAAAVPAIVAFAAVAPSARNLERLQWRLGQGGCGRSLVGALHRTLGPAQQ